MKIRSIFSASSVPKWAAGCALLFSGTILLGWILDLEVLKNGIPNYPPMKANSSIGLFFAGLSLWLTSSGDPNRKRTRFIISKISALIIVLIGGLTLCEYLDFPIYLDELFFKAHDVDAAFPGRMPPVTALNLLLFGIALFILNTTRGYWLAQSANIAVMWISILAFLGYVYEVQALYRLATLTGMAVDSSLTFMILSIGLLFSGPERGLTALITSQSLGGLTLRRLIPAIIIIPIVLGWIPLAGEKYNFYTTEFGVAILVVSLMVLFSIIIFFNAQNLHRADLQRKEAQNLVEAANRELNDFAYIVSHDLKAPINAVGTLANWISSDYADKFSRKSQDQIELVQSNVKHMRQLIDGILEYSKASRTQDTKEKVDLNETVSEIIRRLSPPAHIEISIEDKLPVLQCDKIKMIQVFQNLLSNAIKFLDKPKGEIEIGCKEQALEWVFEVRDNGPGIEKKNSDRIFQMFQTLSLQNADSTGIGLSITKKIVERAGGKIWLESVPGVGTRFFFTVPK
jgi:signal transduction histidine kinase